VLRKFYYYLKPYLPRPLRVRMRQAWAQRIRTRGSNHWPIDPAAGRTPKDWKGWPDHRKFAVLLTHDVEGPVGLARVKALAEVEMSLGFRSSFNFIPEGPYDVPEDLRSWLVDHGFEVGVHDLRHDGKLYASREAFRRNAERINQHLKAWGAVGFRAGFMLHNLDWIHDLEVEYDGSTFDVDPFEPQPDGYGTIFPFWVPHIDGVQGDGRWRIAEKRRTGYLELPYTLPQDSTLFPYLQHETNAIWLNKLKWIAERGGMAMVNVHPDYIAMDEEGREGGEGYPLEHYRSLLATIRRDYADEAWCVVPRELTRHVKASHGGTGPRRPLHACMVSYSFFERDNRVLRYAKTLAERGDFVHVLSLGQDEGNGTPDPAVAAPVYPSAPIEYMDGIRLYHVQTRRRDEKRAIDFLKRVLAFCRRSMLLLIQLQRLRRFDVIHVHNVPDFIILSTWFPKCHGARLILDLHDLLPEFYQSKFHISTDSLFFRALLTVERISCQFADHVIVSNHLWMTKVMARSANPGATTTFVNHVDVELFRPRPFEETIARPLVIFPGGLHPHQGVEVAVKAFVHVLKKHPKAEFHIVGDGPEKGALAELIEQLGLGHSVKMFPPVPLNQVGELLSKAHVGVVPKLADGFGNEAYSTKIMEFMAAGLPVIASRTKIDEHYFGKGEVLFFTSGNEVELAQALDRVLEDPVLRRELVNRGLEYTREHGWSRKSEEYLRVVDGLVEFRPDLGRDAN
jgi:glycosyltransferase involved in cell wall biosynthesis